MLAPAPSTIALLVLLPLVAWRIYMRFRRMIGRQRLSRVRPWITLAIFSIVLVLLAYAARAHVERLEWMATGFAAGGLLAAYGLRLTRFEPTSEGLFYTPNAYLGIALSLLFFGRLLYRVAEVYAKEGKRGGTMTFVVTVQEFRNESGELVAEMRSTAIETGKPPTEG